MRIRRPAASCGAPQIQQSSPLLCPQRALVCLPLVCRVDMQVPAVEVRFEGLHIDTEVYAETGRNLPTILNAYRAVLEVRLQGSRGAAGTSSCGADTWIAAVTSTA